MFRRDGWLKRILMRIDERLTNALDRGSLDNGSRNVPRPSTLAERQKAAAWVEAREAGRLNSPRDVHDAHAWDTYWENHLQVGALQQGFSDVMSSDPTFPAALAARGVRTILCAGNGFSSEALALALHGFDVTALDISTMPASVMVGVLRDPQHRLRRFLEIAIRDDTTITFDGTGPLDPQVCPRIHRSAEYPMRVGGRLLFATGDLTDATACPGPFDAVIERRTVQLFPEPERVHALERLVARLADPGIFVSHQHNGGWKPGQARTHYAEAWTAAQGFGRQWRSRVGAAGNRAREGKVAYLKYTSG